MTENNIHSSMANRRTSGWQKLAMHTELLQNASNPKQTRQEGQGQDMSGENRPLSQSLISEHSFNPETLQLRRSFRIIRRHLAVVLLISIIIPTLVFFFDKYGRSHIYRANIRCEMSEEVDKRMMVGLVSHEAPEIDIDNISRLLRKTDFEKTLRKQLGLKIAELEGEVSKTTDKKTLLLKTSQLDQLRQMVNEHGKSLQKYNTFRGSINSRVLSEIEFEISVEGTHPDIHRLVTVATVDALNKLASKLIKHKLVRTKTRLQKIWQSNLQKIRKTRSRLTELSEAVQATDEGLGRHFNLLQQLEIEQSKTQMQISKQDVQIKHFWQRLGGWEKVQRKFNINKIKDIHSILVSENQLRNKWQKLLNQYRNMVTKYTSAHPQMQKIQNEIAVVKSQLIHTHNYKSEAEIKPLPLPHEEKTLKQVLSLYQEKELLEFQLTDINKRVEKQNQLINSLKPAKLTPQQRSALRSRLNEREENNELLQTNRSYSRKIYTMLTETDLFLKQAENQKRFIALGRPASMLSSPNIVQDVILAITVGLVLGCAAAFLRESVDNHLHTPFDVYYHLRLNYLGIVPYCGENKELIISPETPDSSTSEMYAQLRNNIRYGRPGNPERCLLVVSAIQGEGKSTVSTNIAISYALEGNNVLLIDADMRRPRSHKLVNILKDETTIPNGLSEYLIGTAEFEQVTYETNVVGLKLVPAGSRMRNPAKLLASERMEEIIQISQEKFDIVVVDCAAVLPVVDATTLAPLVQGVLMVVAADEVEIAEARMALYRLQHVQAPFVGAVLNKVRERLTSYYYGYRYRSSSYGYGYGGYGEVYEKEETEQENDNLA